MTGERICSVPGCQKPAATKNIECSMHRSRLSKYGTYDPVFPQRKARAPMYRYPKPPKPPCSVEGCDELERSLTYCTNHYMLNRRNGAPVYKDRQPPRRRPHSAGYVLIYEPGHILARKSYVYEHRLVLFTRIGYGPHRCHWCATHINWRTGIEADHVDYDRANNASANLVESCHGCNTRRARHGNQHMSVAVAR